MAIQQISSAEIADGTVIAADIADGSVTGPKIGQNAINANNVVSGTFASPSSATTYTANQTFVVANVTNQLISSGAAYQNIIRLTKNKKRRPHYANYWRAKWRDKREQMSAHLQALNSTKIMKAQEKVAQVRAITHMLPQEPMSCTRLRDQVAECWNEVYGENLNSNKAWNIVRLCIKHGLFTKDRLNLYTLTAG